MKTHRLLVLLWLGCGLSGAWILYGFVDFYRHRGQYLTPPDGAQIQQDLAANKPASRTERQRRGFPEYSLLFGLNVTGVEPPRADEGAIGPPLPTGDPNRQVAEILRVLVTFHDPSDPSGELIRVQDVSHYCYVKYTDDAMVADPLLAVGDTLPEPFQAIRVKAIFEDKVTFLLEDGQEETLPVELPPNTLDTASILKEVGGAGAASRPAGAEWNVPAGWPEKTTEIDPNRWKIGVADLETFAEKQAEIVGTDIQVVPRYGRGERSPSGLRVTSIKPGSPLEGKGLEARDVVLSVNGVAVRSKEQVFDWALSHPELRSFTLEIERRGRRLTLQYYLPR